MSTHTHSTNGVLAVEVKNLSKCYRIYDHPRDRLLQAVWGRDWRGRKKNYYRSFWALQELSFTLGRGQTLGIVGRNGSGKSTLLQLLCGILKPTKGQIQINGRIGALLELGSGFNPEFSGLENVFINASLLGLSKAETEQRLDQILAFADIGSHINQPVKTYSSGMVVRLAFAVQAHIDPDVLIVDEALAVGDELFQKKCYAHLERLKEKGTAVLLVTHSCPQIIQHCDYALLLHKGKARMLDEPSRVTTTYQRLINANDTEWDEAFTKQVSHNSLRYTTQTSTTEVVFDNSLDVNLLPKSTQIYPSHGARITDAWIETLNKTTTPSRANERVNILSFGEAFVLVFSYEADKCLEHLALSCHIANHTGHRISGHSLPADIGNRSSAQLMKVDSGDRWQARFPFNGGLWPGIYFIGGGIITFNKNGKTYIHRVIDFKALRVLEHQNLGIIGSCCLQAGPASTEITTA